VVRAQRTYGQAPDGSAPSVRLRSSPNSIARAPRSADVPPSPRARLRCPDGRHILEIHHRSQTRGRASDVGTQKQVGILGEARKDCVLARGETLQRRRRGRDSGGQKR